MQLPGRGVGDVDDPDAGLRALRVVAGAGRLVAGPGAGVAAARLAGRPVRWPPVLLYRYVMLRPMSGNMMRFVIIVEAEITDPVGVLAGGVQNAGSTPRATPSIRTCRAGTSA